MFWEIRITMAMVSEELKLLAYLCWSIFGAVTLTVILGMGADNFITSSNLLVPDQWHFEKHMILHKITLHFFFF